MLVKNSLIIKKLPTKITSKKLAREIKNFPVTKNKFLKISPVKKITPEKIPLQKKYQ